MLFFMISSIKFNSIIIFFIKGSKRISFNVNLFSFSHNNLDKIILKSFSHFSESKSIFKFLDSFFF